MATMKGIETLMDKIENAIFNYSRDIQDSKAKAGDFIKLMVFIETIFDKEKAKAYADGRESMLASIRLLPDKTREPKSNTEPYPGGHLDHGSY